MYTWDFHKLCMSQAISLSEMSTELACTYVAEMLDQQHGASATLEHQRCGTWSSWCHISVIITPQTSCFILKKNVMTPLLRGIELITPRDYAAMPWCLLSHHVEASAVLEEPVFMALCASYQEQEQQQSDQWHSHRYRGNIRKKKTWWQRNENRQIYI